MSGLPELSIVIVNWNTRALLRDCLDSLYSAPCQTRFDTWVVDNGSQDGSAQMVRADFPQVQLIASPENVGYARANNLGMRQCQGSTVLLLNSDTVVEPKVLDVTMGKLWSRPAIGALGCQLTGIDGKPQGSYDTRYPAKGPVIGERGVEDEEGLINCAYVWGAYLMVKRAVIDQVGVLDEHFFMFYEDVDWCWRMTEAGWQVVHYPHCEIKHLSRASCKQADPGQISYWLCYSEYLLYRKHHDDEARWLRRRLVQHTASAWQYRVLSLCLPRLRPKLVRHRAYAQALRSVGAHIIRPIVPGGPAVPPAEGRAVGGE